MKKIIFSLFALAAMSLGFVSCGDDDNNAVKHDKTAAVASEGTYVGTCYIYASNADREACVNPTATTPATITFAATDQTYVSNMTIETESKVSPFDNANKTVPVNIAWSNDAIRFSNTSASNPLGCAITSEFINDTVEIRFTQTVREGRKTITYFFALACVKK